MHCVELIAYQIAAYIADEEAQCPVLNAIHFGFGSR
jgi:hypothetical protein